MEKLEEVMATWSRQIEQVLVESEQIRREADNIGPLAELNYWKSRMAKFNTSVYVSSQSTSYRFRIIYVFVVKPWLWLIWFMCK